MSPIIFHADVAYSEQLSLPLCLDMYLPDVSWVRPRPIVLWIHGGGWMSGTKRSHKDVSICIELASHGFAAASIDYRLSSQATYPAQLEDVSAALAWLRENAAVYAIDPARFGAGGHSAGGHLAALVSLKLPDAAIKAVAIGSAPTDFLTPGGLMINDAPSPVTALFGGTVDLCEAEMRAASPAHIVTSTPPPFLIAHGTLDETVPYGQAETLRDALLAAGGEVDFVPLPGRYHNWDTTPEPPIGTGKETELGSLAIPFFSRYL